MSILNFLKKSKNRNLDFFKNNNLEEWWNKNFNEQEKKLIIHENVHLLADNSSSDKSTAKTLYLIAGNVFTKFHNKNPDIIIRILKKAEELEVDPLELFEIYSQLIKLHMKRENEDKKEEKIIKNLCKKQIEISAKALEILANNKDNERNIIFPTHIGYEKLALIKAEAGKKNEATDLIEKAKKEKWRGNWEELLEKIN